MSFYKNTALFKLFYLIIILSFLTFSCFNDSSLTGNSDQINLNKPIEITDYFNTNSDSTTVFEDNINKIMDIIYKKFGYDETAMRICLLGVMAPYLRYEDLLPTPKSDNLNQPYDFRNNYLTKSDKGIDYIACYYILGTYGMENNLLMKYSIEHLSLMNLGLKISQELQHGNNDNQILINNSTYDDLKDFVKIYRDSEKHTDIDIVLDYLETDLEKYYNKTKADIAADFE